jgi:PAS domain S-box-containing protein
VTHNSKKILLGARSTRGSYSVLGLSLVLTLLITFTTAHVHRERKQTRFNHMVEQTRGSLQSALKSYLTLLDSVRGLAMAKVSMNREQFHAYAETLNLSQNYPGIQGLGLAIKINAAQKKEVADKMRTQGEAAFRIWPESDKSTFCPVILLEPQDARNQAMIGYDMFAETVRRTAAERAGQTGQPTATTKLTLLPETEAGSPSGFLVYAPVYRAGKPPDTLEARATNLLGFVYCVFRADDFFKAVFETQAGPAIALRIYDDLQVTEEHLLHDSDRSAAQLPPDPQFTSTNIVAVADRRWALVCSARPEFALETGIHPTPPTLLGGVVMSLLLFGFTRAQTRARATAEEHTAQLQQSEQRFRHLFENGPLPMWVYDVETLRFLDVNMAASEHYGYSRDEFLAMTIEDIRPADDLPGEAGTHASAAPNPAKLGIRKHRKKDGTVIQVEITAHDLLLDGRRGRLVLANDVTARMQAEEEVRRLHEALEQRVRDRTAQLEAAVKELDAFAYTVSHDLRAPLRGTDGFARILLEDFASELPPEAQRYLKLVRQSSQQMGRLIDDLLAFSRLSRQPLKKQNVTLDRLIKQCLEDLLRVREERPIETVIHPLPDCHGDPALLKQVFTNLLGNALKYTRGKTPALIEVGCRTADDVAAEQIVFVKDNGVGFDMQYAGKLFGVFQRLHRTEEYEGTGVGLAIVQRIIHRHGGRVWAESAVNQGTIFFFSLPKYKPAQPEEPHDPSRSQPNS